MSDEEYFLKLALRGVYLARSDASWYKWDAFVAGRKCIFCMRICLDEDLRRWDKLEDADCLASDDFSDSVIGSMISWELAGIVVNTNRYHLHYSCDLEN